MNKLMSLAGLLAVCLPVFAAENAASAPAASRVPPTVSIERPKDTPEQTAIFEAFVDPYLQRVYGGFYAQAAQELPEFNRQVVHKILVEREIALSEAKRPAYPTPAEQMAAVEAVRKAAESRLQQEQGEKVLAAFKRYEASLRHYQTVSQINQVLVFKGEPLNAQQYGYMVTLLQANEPPERRLDFSKEEMDAYIATRQQVHARMLEEAAARFSPAQLDVLKLELELEIRYLRYYDMRNRQAQALAKPVEAGTR